MVNVAEHGDDWRPRLQIGSALLGQHLAPAGFFFFLDRFGRRFLLGNHVEAHLAGDDGRRVEVDLLVDIGHDAIGHQLLDDVDRADAHHGGQFANRHKCRNFN